MKRPKLKVLYVSQEITPYLPESEMSVIGRNLPQAIQEKGKEIRTFMPKYGCINERRNQLQTPHDFLHDPGISGILIQVQIEIEYVFLKKSKRDNSSR